MAGIIKAGGEARSSSGLQTVAFNFEDMTDKANGYLGVVHQQAQEIIARAEKEAIRIRQCGTRRTPGGGASGGKNFPSETGPATPNPHARAGGKRPVHPTLEAGVAEPMGKQRRASGRGHRLASDPPRAGSASRHHPGACPRSPRTGLERGTAQATIEPARLPNVRRSRNNWRPRSANWRPPTLLRTPKSDPADAAWIRNSARSTNKSKLNWLALSRS